jgi:hypothetical protein
MWKKEYKLGITLVKFFMCISMSGVGAQGNPCTAIIFWSIVLPICFIPPVVSYMWRSTVSYKTRSHHNRHFFCRFLVVHISPTRTGELITTSTAPCGWKAYVQRGAAWCPEGIICDTAITTSVPCRSRHDASNLGFGGPEPCLLS